eukprot:scaffold13772_cov96-Isochrysis_galbana.AAC.3
MPPPRPSTTLHRARAAGARSEGLHEAVHRRGGQPTGAGRPNTKFLRRDRAEIGHHLGGRDGSRGRRLDHRHVQRADRRPHRSRCGAGRKRRAGIGV